LTGPPPAPPGLWEAPASSTPPPAPLASSTPPIESTVAAQQPERRWARRTQTRVVTETIVEEISGTPLSQAPPPAARPVFSQTGGGHCPPMHPAPDDWTAFDDEGLQRARMAVVPWRNAFERRCYAFCANKGAFLCLLCPKGPRLVAADHLNSITHCNRMGSALWLADFVRRDTAHALSISEVPNPTLQGPT
jgi:hypothetical protein